MNERLANSDPDYRPGAMTVRRPSVSFGVSPATTVELIDSEVKIAAARDVQYDVFADQEYVGYVLPMKDSRYRPGQEPEEFHGWIGSDNLGGTLLPSRDEAAYRCVARVRARAAARAQG